MQNHIWGKGQTEFFYTITPEIILDAVAKLGFEVTGRCIQLNSMENRVYEVEIENPQDFDELTNSFIIVKFYRPGRWTKEQIKEEHLFMFDLQEFEVPVIAPLKINGLSLYSLEEQNIYYTVFPKRGGRAPDEMNTEQIQIMGRMLARLHNVGATRQAQHRLKINEDTFGIQNLNYLLENNFISSHIVKSYEKIVLDICQLAKPLFQNITNIRIHGDCHCGNIISRDSEGMFFIDFDDTLVGPAVQDIWLIIPGTDQYAIQDRHLLLEAYQEMRDFNFQEIKLVEVLRALRFIHFSTWIAKRWEDPAFKRAFTHFNDPNYWETQLNDLRIQYSLIQESLYNSP